MQYAEVRPGRVRLVGSDEVFVLWLDGVLTPAEVRGAGTQDGLPSLCRHAERILE